MSKIRKNSFEELFTELVGSSLVNDVEAQFKFRKREQIAEQKIMIKGAIIYHRSNPNI